MGENFGEIIRVECNGWLLCFGDFDLYCILFVLILIFKIFVNKNCDFGIKFKLLCLVNVLGVFSVREIKVFIVYGICF